MECKNIECNNTTLGKKIYCSLNCRNIYVNKYIRNYKKLLDTNEEKRKISEFEYIKSPKLCKCGETIAFSKKENNYCNHSCAAKFTNTNRILKPKEIKERKKLAYTLKCFNCNGEFIKERKDIKYCSSECRNEFRRKDIDSLKCYRNDCKFKFSLNDYPNEFEFSLIEEYGWYSPTNKNNNLKGVSRDHMFSVKEGFEKGIDPKLLAHPANCKLMIHNENISKHKSSSITLIELEQRIKEFNTKYN